MRRVLRIPSPTHVFCRLGVQPLDAKRGSKYSNQSSRHVGDVPYPCNQTISLERDYGPRLSEFDGVAVILVTRQTETQPSDRTGKDKQVVATHMGSSRSILLMETTSDHQ